MQHPETYLLKKEHGRNEPIKDLIGASRIILVDEETVGAEDITFGFSRYEPKTAIHKKHSHGEAEELMYIISGRAVGGVNDQEFELEPGDTVWVPRGAVHWIYNPYDEPCEFIFIYTRSSLKKAGYKLGYGEVHPK